MTIGLVGRKCGMTRVFQEDGQSVPVTVVHVEPNIVTQLKTEEKDGYNALQVTSGSKKRSRVNKPEAGHFAKSNVEPGFGLWEFRVEGHTEELQLGAQLTVNMFAAGQFVDVTGTSKGKGFAGPVKRHNFSMQDATHGNSLSHRAHGSTGQNQTPGRVFKGKKMAGHLGDVRKTLQNLVIVNVDAEKNLLLIKGGVPGAIGGNLIIRSAVKK
jgi:large subunit ribosomal protein L3